MTESNPIYTQVFTEGYVFNYENASSTTPRAYERAAEILSQMDGGIKNGETVLEVGSGTGNSTIILARSNPRFGRYIALEPSEGFMNMAAFKFAKTDYQFDETADDQGRAYIMEKRGQALAIPAKVEHVRGTAQNLPVRDNSADRLFCASVIHWLTNKGGNDYDREYLDRSFEEFSRVLKKGGRLLFDTSALQFDPGHATAEGMPFASNHYLAHPFYQKCRENFTEIAQEIGTDFNADPVASNKLYHILDWSFLRDRLARFGFGPLNDDTYQYTFMEFSRQRFFHSFTTGGRMNFFNGDLVRLTEEQRDELLKLALDKTIAENGDLLQIPAGEIQFSFAFIKG